MDIKDLKQVYDENFVPSKEYLKSMPDLQNSDFKGIPIEMVGISDFRLPLRIREKSGGIQEVQVHVTGSVSLDALNRGINMSRILRTFYKSKDELFDINKLKEILENYRKDLKSFDAHILMNFEYRIWQESLRSVKEDGTKEGGWQYYNVTFDTSLEGDKGFTSVMWVDFVYSSACPCSTALSQHAGRTRGIYGIPHSQRSVARIGVQFTDNIIWIEDIIEHCRRALTTEVLVFCKREDEQAFAEKNGAQPKFVEDAVRYLAAELNEDHRIKDYKMICSHLESLHGHNAIAVMLKGIDNSIFSPHVSVAEYKDLVI